jgi:outer membrane protein
MMRYPLCWGVAFAACGLLGAPAQTAGQPAVAPDWTVTVGIEGRVLPAFEGSDRYVLAPYPIVEIRRGGTARRFSAPRDGFGVAILDAGSFRLGPAGKVSLPRREEDDDALRGLGDVDWTVEAGIFIEYWPLHWLRTRAEVRHGFGGHAGVVAELTADLVAPVTRQLTLSAGPRLTLATAEALEPYFGVNAAQSAATGLPVFSPEGGVRAVGAGVQARQQWTPQWATNVFLEYDRLLGDAADSPVLSRGGSADQITVGLGMSYTFDIRLR